MKEINLNQEETSKFSIDDIGGSFTLKFSKENTIRYEMTQIEKLIILLESREFHLEFNVGRKWFDDTIELVRKECKSHLIYCAKLLADSENYR